MSKIEVKHVTGSDISDYIEAIAQLRIEVFREWPYLYEGSLDYEREYLKDYQADPNSFVAIAISEGAVVGASTAIPLQAADRDFQKAFVQSDYSIDSIFYLGESVLLPEYRGHGIGHSFFDAREAQARKYGAQYSAFCAVERSADDPRRPSQYRPLDAFWQKRGYVKAPRIQATFDWREIGESVESTHTLTFWIKEL